jgi:hypothetical protein
MAKDKPTIEEVSVEDPPVIVVMEPGATAETPEQREERLKREDYARRNAEAIREREDIMRRNGVIGPDESLTTDMEAAIRQRCCN